MTNADISHSLQTVYADLVQQLETAPIGGSTYERDRDGIRYRYAKIPVGTSRIDTFLGRAGDPSVDRQARDLQTGMALAKQRRAMVSLLKSNGFAAPDKTAGAVLDTFAHAGLFAAGAVLVGTAAYLMFEPLVGRRLPAPTLTTGDVDLATVDVAIAAAAGESLADILKRADDSFEPVMQIDPRQRPVRYRNRKGYLVDLLTQTRRRDERPVPLENLEAAAEPLQHLGWLIESPVTAAALHGAGVLVRTPQPARFAAHKLIVAQRRHANDRAKRQKDLRQASALMAAIRDSDPFALDDAIEDARAQGRSWAQSIDRSIAEIDAQLNQIG